MFDELKIAARFVIQSSCGLSQETHAAVVRQMPVRSGPWQGTRPMQCTWRSTSATVEDVEGGSWEGLEPANLVGESEWLESFFQMFFRSKCLKLTLMVSPQPPPRLMPQIEPPLQMPELVMMKDPPPAKDATGGAEPRDCRLSPESRQIFPGWERFVDIPRSKALWPYAKIKTWGLWCLCRYWSYFLRFHIWTIRLLYQCAGAT